MVQPVEIPRLGSLPRHEYSKEELLEIWEKLHTDYELDIRTGVRVTGVTGQQGDFTVETSGGPLRARHVVLALGRRGTPRRLNVPGEDLAKVAYKLIDAEAYAGRRVLVVGGGDSAVEAAMGLAHQEGCQVTLSYRKPDLMRIKQRNAERIAPLIAGAIDFRGGTTVGSIHPDKVVLDGPAAGDRAQRRRVHPGRRHPALRLPARTGREIRRRPEGDRSGGAARRGRLSRAGN